MSDTAADPAAAKAARRRQWWRYNRPVVVLAVAVLVIAAVALVSLDRRGMFETGFRVVTVFRDVPADVPFARGVRMAVDEVNSGGGMHGNPLVLEEVVEPYFAETDPIEDVVNKTLEQAYRIARRPSVLAVIGHTTSATAVPASSVYERNNTVFLATHATAVSLTEHDFRYVFGLQPSNADSAAVIARYAIDNGMRKFVVLSDRSSYGTEAANEFRRFAAEMGAEILYHGDLAHRDRSIDRILLFMLDNNSFNPSEIDAFFLGADSADETIRFIQRSRELGLTVPILGTDHIYSSYVESRVGVEGMRGVTTSSTFEAQSRNPIAIEFGQRYRDRFGEEPDVNAAIGYDAVKLYAFVADRVRPHDAGRIADLLHVMRYEQPFRGVTGPLVFDARGLVTDTHIYVVEHDGTAFRTVATYEKPLGIEVDDGASPLMVPP